MERWWIHQRRTVDHTWGWERGAIRFGGSLWGCMWGKMQSCLWGSKLRTVWKTPWLAMAAVEQHLGIISFTINTLNVSFCLLQGEILHRLQADLGHLSSMD